MNEFVIEWIKGSSYAGVTAPIGSALKSKLLKLAEKIQMMSKLFQ